MKYFLIYFLALTGVFQAPGVAPHVPLLRSDMEFEVTSEQDQLSLLTQYAGLGYNLLYGNPEGSYHLGGIDPGIMSTR